MQDTGHRTQDSGGRGPGWRALWIVLLPCAFWSPCAKAEQVAPAPAMQPATMPAAVDEAKVMVKTVVGKVVSMTKRTLSVEYEMKASAKEVEYDEMLLPFGTEMTLERISSMKELKPGDLVSVQYRQHYRVGEDGQPVILNTEIASLALMKSGAEGLRSTP